MSEEANVRYARWDRVLMGDGHYSMVAVDVTDEIAALRQRLSTLQEVVRQMDRIQGEVAKWTKRFRPTPDAPANPLADAASIAEEAGEVCRAVLKRAHGLRPDTDWTANLRDEAADVLISLLSLAANEGWSLADALDDRWQEVQQR